MKKFITAMSLLVSFNFPTWALDVGDISSFIYSDSVMLSKEIKNTTSSGRLINIDIERITSPLAEGKIIPMENKDEILYTPGSTLLPAHSSETIRFYYKGPEDNQERYYRIIWTDQALSMEQQNKSVRSAMATASARISTILVVTPRKAHYNYHYTNGSVSNTGNATLRIIAYGSCQEIGKGDQCHENYFLLPGRTRKFTKVNILDPESRIAAWQAEQFLPIK
ncbi:EcpB family pilus assembly chaperone [Kosakonia sp.]|uniref:EcpB family pilus assembly chaperone n=1 Tax=Kosakonia sp. TaxID=1916651 RepID=UPI002897A2ED|nr:hypothetical protein [Kosakonia sp.]